MRFGTFAANYLNPFTLLFRAGILSAGGMAMGVGITGYQSGEYPLIMCLLIIWPVGLYLLILGVKPWYKDGGGYIAYKDIGSIPDRFTNNK